MGIAHAKASIGTTNYAVTIDARHHQLQADEPDKLGRREPLKEPVVWYGPIVMNTQEQLQRRLQNFVKAHF